MTNKANATSGRLVANGTTDGALLHSTVPDTTNCITDGEKMQGARKVDFGKLAVPPVVPPEPPKSEDASTPVQPTDEPIRREPVFKPLSMKDLLSRPPKQYLLQGVFGAGDVGMVYGGPGSGKTFLVIDMILSLCTGRQWAMQFDVERPLNVAYCAGEGGDGLRNRFAAALWYYGVDDLPNFSYYEVPQLYDDQALGNIHEFIRDRLALQEQGAPPLDLLCIDTMHTATVGADENSSKDMGKVLHACKAASKALGCAVLLVHHTNKAGTGERGSSSLRGAMDFMIEISRVSDTGTLATMRCAKLKDGEQWRERTFDLTQAGDDIDSVRVWWNEPTPEGQTGGKEKDKQQTMLTVMSDHPGKRFTAKMLAEAAGIGQTYANKLLAKMVESGECRRELQDPNSEGSSRNPLVYYVLS